MKKSLTGKLLAICLVLLAPILYNATVSAKKPDDKAKMTKASPLPTIQTNTKFKELIANVYKPDITLIFGRSSYRSVNVVKTDSQYIYWANGSQINIIDASHPEKLQIVNKPPINSPGRLRDIHIYKDRLIAITSDYNVTEAHIYDLSKKPKIRKPRQIKLGGNYISSQVIDSHFYLLSNEIVNAGDYQVNKKAVIQVPSFTDSMQSNKTINMNLRDVNYLPNSMESDHLVVMGLDLDDPEAKTEVNAYFGAGVNTYVTGKNIYVPVRVLSAGEQKKDQAKIKALSPRTAIFKFELYQGKVYFTRKAVVDGGFRNKAAINEENGRLRVATLKGDIKDQSANSWLYEAIDNIYLFDKNLKVAGSLRGLAEKLNSPGGSWFANIEFIGDNAYIENFRKPPLMGVDLSDRTGPKLIGAVKSPQSANFLNFYFENEHIGVGEVISKTGRTTGMRLIMADHSDIKRPKVRSDILLGDRGTEASIVLLDKERKLLAVAVNITRFNKKKQPVVNNGRTILDENADMGKPVFKGAYIYSIDKQKGLRLKGKLTHLTEQDDVKKSKEQLFYKLISNILVTDHALYALSPSRISAHDPETLKEISSISIKPPKSLQPDGGMSIGMPGSF